MGSWKGDSNPGGPGGRTRKIPTNVPRGKTSHRGGGGTPPKKKGCCSMVAAARAARTGRFRLAARYVRMTPRFIGQRFA